jgi:hypothetical protein
MRYRLSYFAKDPERFAHDAFRHNLGKEINVRMGEDMTAGTVLGVDVIDEGTAAVLMIEIPDDSKIARRIKEVVRYDGTDFSVEVV